MPIKFKVACTPKEIDDALWLRHQVYVAEEGLYGGESQPDERIVDRFDVIPLVAHIIAYDGDEPVAGIRLNCDMGLGLPSEKYFDFGPYRPAPDSITDDRKPVIASGGMLAIRRGWRQRRDVTREVYRVSFGVFYSWNVTHVVAAVSEATASIYRRMGFKPVAESVLSPRIGDRITPLMARAEDCYRWAFGDDMAPREPIWQERRRVSCKGCHNGLVGDGLAATAIALVAAEPELDTSQRTSRGRTAH